MFMHGDAAIFCADAVMCRMLAALCGTHACRVAVADGDDAIMQADAYLYCREQSLPLLLFTRTPAAMTLPVDINGIVLGRPFLFADFIAALRQLHDVSPVQEIRDSRPLLRWDPVRRAVLCDGAEILLTQREADVFAALYAASPAPVSREKLQKEFARTDGNGADVYVSYLRRKLADLPLCVQIHAVRGQGYALLIQSAPTEAETIPNDSITGEI